MKAEQNEMRVRMLLRVSSRQQMDAEGDLPTQRNIVKGYIEKQEGWKLDDVKPEYFEGGVSGYKNSVEDREVLQEILEDAKKREFDILVCYKDDRLGRREDEIPQYIKELASNGVLVCTTKDGCITPKTHEDALMIFLRYWHAEGASRDTAQRVRDAAIEHVKQGKNQGGNAPFGYELEFSGELSKHNRALKKKVIVPEKAEIVRYMYDLVLTRGYGILKITKTLNEDEKMRAMSPNGKVWKTNTVGDILRNPIYTGYITYNRRTHDGEHYKRLDKENWILSEKRNEELVIVDLDTWERVQRIREAHKEQYGKKEKHNVPMSAAGQLPLIDVAYCGCCGQKLTNGSKYNYWESKKGPQKRQIGYYRCPTKHRGEFCEGKGLFRADNIEPIVFKQIKDYLETLEDDTTIIEKIEETGKQQSLQREKNIQKLEDQLLKMQKDIETLKDNLPKVLRGELNVPLELFYEQIEKKEQDKNELEGKIEGLKAEKEQEDQADIELADFIAQIPTWREAFDNGDVSVKRMLVNKLVSRVEVEEDKITIQFRVNLGEFLSRKSSHGAV